MLAGIDLTHRQAARAVEQALRSRAVLDIDPRCRPGTLYGTLVGRDRDLLQITLHDHGERTALAALVGTFCDIKTVLSGDLYQFTTCVVDATEDSVPQQLLLAVPDVMSVANRRRFDRKRPSEQFVVQVWPADRANPLLGVLWDIGMGGLCCILPAREADDSMLIDDEARIRFQLPWGGQSFELTTRVCVKSQMGKTNEMKVGLEFTRPIPGEAINPDLERLRQVLAREYIDGSGPKGGDA